MTAMNNFYKKISVEEVDIPAVEKEISEVQKNIENLKDRSKIFKKRLIDDNINIDEEQLIRKKKVFRGGKKTQKRNINKLVHKKRSKYNIDNIINDFKLL